MLDLIARTLWFLFPALIGNTAPVCAKWVFRSRFQYPVDCYLKINKKRIFGDNKTWRGIVSTIFVSILVVFLQRSLFEIDVIKIISILDYSSVDPLFLGASMGASVCIGDLSKSLFKRQLGIKPGQSWIPFDQLDIPLGFTILVFPIIKPPVEIMLMSYLLVPPLAYIFSRASRSWQGPKPGIQDAPLEK